MKEDAGRNSLSHSVGSIQSLFGRTKGWRVTGREIPKSLGVLEIKLKAWIVSFRISIRKLGATTFPHRFLCPACEAKSAVAVILFLGC